MNFGIIHQYAVIAECVAFAVGVAGFILDKVNAKKKNKRLDKVSTVMIIASTVVIMLAFIPCFANK